MQMNALCMSFRASEKENLLEDGALGVAPSLRCLSLPRPRELIT